MRALRIHAHGGLERLVFEDLPDPVPGPGEVRIKVAATSLNHLDLWVRRGVPGHRFPLPITPGCDAAGWVDRLGAGVTHWREGDEVVVAPGFSCGVCRVCVSGEDNLCSSFGILGETRDGADAEFVVVPARNLLQRPRRLDFPAAASFALTFLTAWHMLVARATVRPGETVLILAAGSGVSSAALQIATLLGARVLAAAGSAPKRERALTLGARQVFDSRSPNLGNEVRAVVGRAGVDVVFDHVGEATFGTSMRLLARGGRYVFCGATSGFEMKTDFRPLFFRNLSILGSTMGGLHELHCIRDLIEDGRLQPIVDRVLPLAEAVEAHRALEAGEAFGKIALRVAEAA